MPHLAEERLLNLRGIEGLRESNLAPLNSTPLYYLLLHSNMDPPADDHKLLQKSNRRLVDLMGIVGMELGAFLLLFTPVSVLPITSTIHPICQQVMLNRCQILTGVSRWTDTQVVPQSVETRASVLAWIDVALVRVDVAAFSLVTFVTLTVEPRTQTQTESLTHPFYHTPIYMSLIYRRQLWRVWGRDPQILRWGSACIM